MFEIDAELLKAFLFFASMFFAAGLGAPIPEEIAVVCAGLWTANNSGYGLLRWLMLPVCVVSVVLSDSFLYTVGRLYGERLLNKPWMLKWVPKETQNRIIHNFDKYGVNILLVGRLVPGIRMPLFLTAGLLRLSVARFILADGIGAGIGNSIFFLLAFWFGEQFKTVLESAEEKVTHAWPIAVMVVLAGVAIYLLVRYLRKPVSEGDPEQLPIIGHQVATHIPHLPEEALRDIKHPPVEANSNTGK